MTLNLTESIAATLAYFDVFDYPLTAMELAAYLWRTTPIGLEQLQTTLAKQWYPASSVSDGLRRASNETMAQWQQSHGFYFLPGRKAIIEMRQHSVRHVATKLDRAKKAGKLIRWIPFVQAMFVCNTVAAGSADEESDIDVLVIVKSGRLWLTRLLVTGLLGLFRLRRTKTRIANQICLSFYLTDTALNLKSIALPDPDIYLCYWIRQLLPTYDPAGMWETIQQKNQWVDEYVRPAPLPYEMIERYRVNNTNISRGVKKVFEKFWTGRYGALMEAQAKGFEQTRMKLHDVNPSATSRSVIVNDTMMKFHENDRREHFREEWRKRYQTKTTSI